MSFSAQQRLLNKQRGLNLIEVLVTLTITSIGLMGLVSLQMQSINATQNSGSFSHAIWIHNDLASRIRANFDAADSYVTNGVDCANPPARVCSSYFTGSQMIRAQQCDGAEMAAWDLYETACGLPKDAGVFGSHVRTTAGNQIIGYIPGLQINVTCTIAARCQQGLVATLNWNSKEDGLPLRYGQGTEILPLK